MLEATRGPPSAIFWKLMATTTVATRANRWSSMGTMPAEAASPSIVTVISADVMQTLEKKDQPAASPRRESSPPSLLGGGGLLVFAAGYSGSAGELPRRPVAEGTAAVMRASAQGDKHAQASGKQTLESSGVVGTGPW